MKKEILAESKLLGMAALRLRRKVEDEKTKGDGMPHAKTKGKREGETERTTIEQRNHDPVYIHADLVKLEWPSESRSKQNNQTTSGKPYLDNFSSLVIIIEKISLSLVSLPPIIQHRNAQGTAKDEGGAIAE